MSTLRNRDGLRLLVLGVLRAVREFLERWDPALADERRRHTEKLGALVAERDEAERSRVALSEAVDEAMTALALRGHQCATPDRLGATVRTALDVPPPAAAEVVPGLTADLTKWSDSPDGAHTFLPPRLAERLAYVLAPRVAGWIAAARASDSRRDGERTVDPNRSYAASPETTAVRDIARAHFGRVIIVGTSKDAADLEARRRGLRPDQYRFVSRADQLRGVGPRTPVVVLNDGAGLDDQLVNWVRQCIAVGALVESMPASET